MFIRRHGKTNHSAWKNERNSRTVKKSLTRADTAKWEKILALWKPEVRKRKEKTVIDWKRKIYSMNERFSDEEIKGIRGQNPSPWRWMHGEFAAYGQPRVNLCHAERWFNDQIQDSFDWNKG